MPILGILQQLSHLLSINYDLKDAVSTKVARYMSILPCATSVASYCSLTWQEGSLQDFVGIILHALYYSSAAGYTGCEGCPLSVCSCRDVGAELG